MNAFLPRRAGPSRKQCARSTRTSTGRISPSLGSPGRTPAGIARGAASGSRGRRSSRRRCVTPTTGGSPGATRHRHTSGRCSRAAAPKTSARTRPVAGRTGTTTSPATSGSGRRTSTTLTRTVERPRPTGARGRAPRFFPLRTSSDAWASRGSRARTPSRSSASTRSAGGPTTTMRTACARPTAYTTRAVTAFRCWVCAAPRTRANVRASARVRTGTCNQYVARADQRLVVHRPPGALADRTPRNCGMRAPPPSMPTIAALTIGAALATGGCGSGDDVCATSSALSSDGGADGRADAAAATDAPAGDASMGEDNEAAADLARVRFANWSPDSPAVDFCLAEHGTTEFQGPLLAGLAAQIDRAGLVGAGQAVLQFPDVSAYISVEPQALDVRIVAAGS